MKNNFNCLGIVNKISFTVKLRLLILSTICFLSFKNSLFSQNVAQQTASTTLLGNTGVSLTGSGGMTMNSLTSGNDPRWTANTTTATGSSAIIIPVPPSSTNCPTWSPNGTGGGSSWITMAGVSCGAPPVLGNYSCTIPPVTDIYFKLTFTLNSTPMFFIDWQLFASDYIAEIRVNSVPAYTVGALVPPLPNQRQNPISFKWCTNWKVGLNEIIVRVKANTAFASECRLIGLKVIAWGNYSSYSSITGPGFPYILCTGSSAQFIAATKASLGIPASSPVTYSWTKPSGWGGPASTNNTLNINPVGTISGMVGVGVLTLTSNGYQCISTGGYSITVPPPLTITPSSPTVCTGKSLTLTVSGAPSYAWYDPGNNYLANTNTIQITPTAGLSVYKVIGSNMGCTYTKTISINTFVTPTLAVTLNTNVICVGATASLQVTGNAWQYKLLNPPPNGIIIFPAPVSVLVSTNVTTAYTIQARSIPGCTNNSIISLSVVPIPTITAVATPSVICPGGSSSLFASGGMTYNWLGFGPLNPRVVSPGVSTTYTVVGSQGGCSGTKTVNVSVLSAPSVTVNPPNICPGITNTLTAGGAITYNWILGPPINSTFNNTPTVSFNSSVAIAYTVTGTGPAPGSCTGTATGIIPLGSPIPISAPNVTLCTNGGPCTTLTASSSLTTNVTYTWMTSPAVTGTAVTVCPILPNSYIVNASSTISGCPSSSIVNVSIATNCCPQSTLGMTALNPATGLGGPHINTSYVLDGSITLTASASFANSEVWITPGVSIIVPSGMVLDLDKTHLFACGINMWQGIVVQDGGRITTQIANTRLANSMIEDAVVGIDLDNISLANSSPNMPIDIQRIIFNKNLIGIKISNSVPTLTALTLGISGCVFSSRSMSFATFPSTLLAWPSSECQTTVSLNGLRVASQPTTGLIPPYSFTFTQSNLKQPYNTQPGHIGIKVENIGDPNSMLIEPGVNIGEYFIGGSPAMVCTNDFNLFDGLGVGFEVTDASLKTKNNVFQNMQYYPTPLSTFTTGMYGGIGIQHIITNTVLMNARCDLRASNKDEGNRFWDCNTGIFASNVHDFWIENNLFRSTHTASLATLPNPMPGDTGVSVFTNRFDCTINHSEFNNLKYGIVFNTPAHTYSYNIPSMPLALGVCYRGLYFHSNYFGPEVLSPTPYSSGSSNTSEYMGNAIQVNTPNTTGWARNPNGYTGSLIISNKINRAFRGISVNGTEDMPLSVSGNTVLIEDDYTFCPLPGIPAFGYGISATNKLDSLSVQFNTLEAQPWHLITTNNPTISLVYCNNNFGNTSPRVECNSVKNSYYGFQFDGNNPSTVWEGNEMCTHFAGLALTNNGVIGPQGTPSLGSGNIWDISCALWGSPNARWHTYSEDSDPSLSFLYVQNIPPNNPTWNGNNPGNLFTPPNYSNGPSIDNSSLTDRLMNCIGNNLYLPGTPAPNWRQSIKDDLESSSKAGELNDDKISIYPNPTNGQLTILSLKENEILQIRIFDLSGKLIYMNDNFNTINKSIDISNLEPTMYLIEIRTSENNILRKKLVKTE